MTSPALTVVSAACSQYARSLWQLLRSAERRRWLPRARFVAYDLGMAPEQRRALAARFPWCELRSFEFSRYPPHIALAERRYAWKPIVVAEVFDEVCATGGQLLWLDSATVLKAGPGEVQDALSGFGVYTLAGQSPLSRRADASALRALAVDPEVLSWPERAAGVVGFDSAHAVARELVDEWRRAALEGTCLGPPLGEHHKPEQQLLSVLLFRRVLDGQLRLNPGEIDVSSRQPVRWMSSRNKVRPGTPEWLDGWTRLRSATWKRLDRLSLCWQRVLEPWLSGLERWPRDHYQVYLRLGTDDLRVRAPLSSYYADPFPWQADGSPWLFVEEYQYARSRGRLVALEFDPMLAATREPGARVPHVRVRKRHVLRELATHASFPLPFEADGTLYLLPETRAERVVDLYRCQALPGPWVRAQRLLRDVDAVDSVPLRHEGRWWLITSLCDGGDERRYLGIFSSPDLLAADWEPHPVNAERRRHRADGTDGRCAGPIVREAGRLLRPVQVTPRHYGQDMRLMEVLELTRSRFVERPCAGDHALASLLRAWPAHHAAACGELIAFDVRDRVRRLDGLWALAGLGRHRRRR